MINLKLRGSLPPWWRPPGCYRLGWGCQRRRRWPGSTGLVAKGALHPEDHDNLKDAFQFISQLLLRQQVEISPPDARSATSSPRRD